MASPREIKNRISSVTNTQKITRTMELVSTAKAKKAVDRVQAAQPFAVKIKELISSLSSLGSHMDHPLLAKREKINKAALLIVTANRGLCGGFNSNVLRLASSRISALAEAGAKLEIHLIGKKAVSYFNFRNMKFTSAETKMDDKPSFELASRYADDFMRRYSHGELDHVEIIFTHYINAVVQRPVANTILPISLETGNDKAAVGGDVIFEPAPEVILQALLPRAIRVSIYQALLESTAGEQIARRIAMKNATDAAGDMIRSMTLDYNRARQSKITQEIAEIVGGATAISG